MILHDCSGPTSEEALISDATETRRVDRRALERMAARLEATGSYRILRRMEPRAGYHAPDGTPTRRGIFLDVETTGLDPATDEIVELAMVPFDFACDERMFAVHEPFSWFRDLGPPIANAASVVTGFDCRFMEKLYGAFETLPWVCSWVETSWAVEGFDSAKLGHLTVAHGFFHVGHLTAHDCRYSLASSHLVHRRRQ